MIYCTNNTIRSSGIPEIDSLCQPNYIFVSKYNICIQDSEESQALLACKQFINPQHCIEAQAECVQKMQPSDQICIDVLNTDGLLNNNIIASKLQNGLFNPQKVILSERNKLSGSYSQIQLYMTIFNENGIILYDGKAELNLCNIFQLQSSNDQQYFFKLANYNQQNRYEQFGISKRYSTFQNIINPKLESFNMNFSQNTINYLNNKTQQCKFSLLKEKLYLRYYAIDNNGTIQELYVNLMEKNETILQNVKLIPLSPDNYIIKNIQIKSIADEYQIQLSNITVQYANLKKNQFQNSLITDTTTFNPQLLGTTLYNEFKFQYLIKGKNSPLKIILIVLFLIIGCIMSFINCINYTGSSNCLTPTTYLQLEMNQDQEIIEKIKQNYIHLLFYFCNVLIYFINSIGIGIFIWSIQFFNPNLNQKRIYKNLFGLSTKFNISMYVISQFAYLYVKISQIYRKYFFYPTQVKDNISDNFQDPRLIQIANKFLSLCTQSPVNQVNLLLITQVFYYLLDEFYHSQNDSFGFTGIEQDQQVAGFIFIYTLLYLILFTIKYILSLFKPNSYKQFENVLGSTGISLIIQETPYTVTVINHQPTNSTDILDLANELQNREKYLIQQDRIIAVKHYLSQQQDDGIHDVINMMQKVYASAKLDQKLYNKKVGQTKISKVVKMNLYSPDSLAEAENCRILASNSDMINEQKLTTFMNLPFFIDFCMTPGTSYRMEKGNKSDDVFIENCSWKKSLCNYKNWLFDLSYVLINFYFYCQFNVSTIGFILILGEFYIMEKVQTKLIRNQISLQNCIEMNWLEQQM